MCMDFQHTCVVYVAYTDLVAFGSDGMRTMLLMDAIYPMMCL